MVLIESRQLTPYSHGLWVGRARSRGSIPSRLSITFRLVLSPKLNFIKWVPGNFFCGLIGRGVN